MANKLREKRQALNMTLKEVAELVGVSEGTVSRWEREEITNLKREHIYKYALALGMSPLEIMSASKDTPESITDLANSEDLKANQIKRFMAYWYALNTIARDKLEEYARDLYNNPSYKK